MEDVKNTPQGVPGEPAEILRQAPSEPEKKKSIDEMIEEMNKGNPAKNHKKRIRGVF
jgi:hypothetical protein